MRIHKDQTSQEQYVGLGQSFRLGVPPKFGVAGRKEWFVKIIEFDYKTVV